MVKAIIALYMIYYVGMAFITTQAIKEEDCKKLLDKSQTTSPLIWPMVDGCFIKSIKIERSK